MEDEAPISDFHAIGEKHTQATEQAELLVIGAGPKRASPPPWKPPARACR